MKFFAKLMEAFMRLLSLQPLKVHRFWGKVLGSLVGNVFRYRRDVVMVNLSRSFPEKKYAELTAIAGQFYRHFGTIFTEAVWFSGAARGKRLHDSRIREFLNPALLEEYFRECPSVMVLLSHMGNWELHGGSMSYIYDGTVPTFRISDAAIVYKALSSRFWDQVTGDNRNAADPGVKEGVYIESSDILRFVVEHKDEKKIYLFNTDQHPYRNSVPQDAGIFMNQPTRTMNSAAAIAHKYGMGVLYMSEWIDGEGNYKVTFKEVCKDGRSQETAAIMRRYYDFLEEDLRAQPWNYLWTHKRWK